MWPPFGKELLIRLTACSQCIIPGGPLAGQLSTDARTKDYKNYHTQCVQHFENDTPFHCVQSKSDPFQCFQLKCILSNTSATIYIGKILPIFRSSGTTRHPLLHPYPPPPPSSPGVLCLFINLILPILVSRVGLWF